MDFRDKDKEEKAKLEDILIEILYAKYDDLVFHGGTCIWRCYNGNRFSRDLDLYYDSKGRSAEDCFKEFSDFFKEKKFTIKTKSYGKNTNTMQFLLESTIKMKVDINLNYKKGTPTEYMKIDESRIVVLALTPEELLKEKINAYEDKLSGENGFKEAEAQDLYDIYYLTSISRKDARTTAMLKKLLNKIGESEPRNIRSLNSLVLSGIAPTFDLMIKSIGKWVK